MAETPAQDGAVVLHPTAVYASPGVEDHVAQVQQSDFQDKPNPERRTSMDYAGCAQWSYLLVCPAELEAEGDRLTTAHTQWMRDTHHREGDKALLFRLVTKGPHPSRPDAVVFALTEVYQSQAGFDDHLRQVHEEWDEFPAWQAFVDKCEGPWGVNGEIQHSLW